MADENTQSSDTADTSATKSEESLAIQKQELPLGLDATKMCSPNILSTPRLKPPLPFTSKTNELKSNVLGPSQLNGSANLTKSTTAFMLNPSKLNPFTKISSNEDPKENIKTDLTPKFLPLLQNGNISETNCEKSESKPLPSTSQSNFVFGENIQDRVVSDKAKSDTANSNGTSESEMLFTSAIKETSGISSKPNCTKSLSESAREYEESRAIKRKYEEVEIKTGEEGETNVLQISCKLFAFDKSGGGTWQERGRGILRLNDKHISEDRKETHSRLVFRTAGSLRVVLNTKIWAEMTVQVASNKSVRFTAFDSKGEVRVFLITGSPEDIKQLHRHLEIRVKKEVEYQKVKGDIVSTTEPDRKKLAGTSN